MVQALTWQIQERSGIRVQVEEAPDDDEVRYNPVTFDEDGVPIAPASIGTPRVEKFAPDGTPLLTAGTTATLTMHAFGRTVEAPVRVVSIIDEPDRKGFAYGTLDGHPLSGEESFVVERTPDGSVKGCPVRCARVPGAWLAMHRRAVAEPWTIGRGSWGRGGP